MKRGQPIGWARVLTGAESCPFCVMLASRGAVYQSKETAAAFKHETKQGHNACDCRIVPVWDKNHWEGKEQADALYEKWLEVANREEHPDQWGAWRRWYENQAAEGEHALTIREKVEPAATTEPENHGKASVHAKVAQVGKRSTSRRREESDTRRPRAETLSQQEERASQEPGVSQEITLNSFPEATEVFAHTGYPGIDSAISSAVREWTGPAYELINDHLRNGAELEDRWRDTIARVDQFLEEHRLVEPIRVVRREKAIDWTGVRVEDAEQLEGIEIDLAGYTATTFPGNREIEPFGNVEWVLSVPAGTRCAPVASLSRFPDEGEILLGRDTRILVEEIERDGKWCRIHARVMKESDGAGSEP